MKLYNKNNEQTEAWMLPFEGNNVKVYFLYTIPLSISLKGTLKTKDSNTFYKIFYVESNGTELHFVAGSVEFIDIDPDRCYPKIFLSAKNYIPNFSLEK